jgi:hypothetical protein
VLYTTAGRYDDAIRLKDDQRYPQLFARLKLPPPAR